MTFNIDLYVSQTANINILQIWCSQCAEVNERSKKYWGCKLVFLLESIIIFGFCILFRIQSTSLEVPSPATIFKIFISIYPTTAT
jgi:hypothetical protein